ncbi:MAG: hypothetical protein DRP79_00540 [Planctomycetota bacterium]|nr:MAG: hypothetical protein DRP79_00540 [Planctomycetota bacterium]
MADNPNDRPGQAPHQPPPGQMWQQGPHAQQDPYGRAQFTSKPEKDDIPDEPPVDEKIGEGFFSIIPRVLRLRDALYFDIKDDRASYKFIAQMALVALVCFMIYGFVMGTYNHFPRQSISSMVKLPLVFMISLAVLLPTLYLIGILLNLRVYFRQMLGLFVMSVCATSLVLVCMAPITGFCLITISRGASRYNLLMLVNIVILGLSGLVGLAYLARGSKFLARKREKESGVRPKSRFVLFLWMLAYALVGIQLAWALRPYMGRDRLDFQIIRPAGQRDFYSSVVLNIGELTGATPLPRERARRQLASLALEYHGVLQEKEDTLKQMDTLSGAMPLQRQKIDEITEKMETTDEDAKAILEVKKRNLEWKLHRNEGNLRETRERADALITRLREIEVEIRRLRDEWNLPNPLYSDTPQGGNENRTRYDD